MEHSQLCTRQLTSVSQRQEMEGEESAQPCTESRGGDRETPGTGFRLTRHGHSIMCFPMCQEGRHITRNQMSGKGRLLGLLEKLQRVNPLCS